MSVVDGQEFVQVRQTMTFLLATESERCTYSTLNLSSLTFAANTECSGAGVCWYSSVTLSISWLTLSAVRMWLRECNADGSCLSVNTNSVVNEVEEDSSRLCMRVN